MRGPMKVQAQPSTRQTEMREARLAEALADTANCCASSGLSANMGAPSTPHKYQAAIRKKTWLCSS